MTNADRVIAIIGVVVLGFLANECNMRNAAYETKERQERRYLECVRYHAPKDCKELSP